MGLTLAADNIFKFMTTTSCLDKIRKIMSESSDPAVARNRVKAEFTGKSIVANWGIKRTYIVSGVDFDQNPSTHKFVWNEKEITLAEYFGS